MNMDNFELKVTGEDREEFDLAFQIAFLSQNSATGWTVSPIKGLIFHWCRPDHSNKVNIFPTPLDWKRAADIAWDWLNKMDRDEFIKYADREPDHDGDNGRGYSIYNESWGHIDHDWSGFVAVVPRWAMHGK